MKFESHPDVPLIEHIKEVYENSKKFMYADNEDILYCLEIAAKSHDFGKYTTHFQKRLYNKAYRNVLADHSYISAVFGGYVATNKLGEDSYLPLVIYSVIVHHHGNLKDIKNKLPKNKKDIRNLEIEIEDINKQLDDMQENKEFILKDMKKINLEKEFSDFLNYRPIEKTLFHLRKLYSSMSNEELFYKHQLIYSALIDGDKISASKTQLNDVSNINYDDLLDLYNEKFPKVEGFSSIRREVFESIQKNIEKNYNERLFSITAPTGTGKTLAGFYSARKLSEYHGNRKIIYALPFTSIIDQNYNEIYKLYENLNDFHENSSEYLIKHHSLTEYDYKSKDNNYDLDQSKLLTESWHSSIIITTFVQFFESILGGRNKMLKKLHSIKGSIIILDELQSIDIKYWRLIDYLLKKIAIELDCRVITMTATKPVILQESIELLDNYEKYFKMLNRVELEYNDYQVTLKEFTEDFMDDLEEDKSYLIICNTIGQSLKIYKEIKDLDREVIYLSTNIIPKERKLRIDTIKKSMKYKPIVISTQVVEAGVDLDFDYVIRDLAPLDSIIQAAGRCNRNNMSEGKVKVVKMINEKEELFGKYIYGSILLNITRDILQDKTIKESDFLKLIENYFKEVYQKKNTDDIFSEYKSAMDALDFETIIGFSVIANRPNYIDVFFQIDEESVELLERYKEIKNIKDYKEKYKKLLKITPEMREYMISLPDKFIGEFDIDNYNKIITMPFEDKKRVYDNNTGFKRDDIGGYIFM
ncbi:MAG: CRISPR-associated helicase Cas3' [Senegalia sp. (in: firmicutes)]|uniref:CRISPR-associated helicase Cas3' n=1 Tax=Senegalia sp. (in: firmicutes) TaxID=1924098 RepID=UPI003F971184